MAKRLIKLTEEKLKEIIREECKKIIAESKDINTISFENTILSVRSFDMYDEEDRNFINQNKDIIWDILQKGYENIGGFKGFQTKRDMIKKASLFHLGFQNGEIITVSVYNDYLDGNKCVGMTCVKDEKHKNAVTLLNLIIEYDIQNWNEWIWIEASGKIEEMFKKQGGFNVPSKYVQIFLRAIPYEVVDNYHYARTIGGNKEVKTIFGFKDKSTFEILKKEIADKVNSFINNKSINENTEKSEQERIWNEFNKNQPEIEKHRDIINYFVYLKDDELINEFPKESLDILKKSISFIRDALKNEKYDIKKERIYNLTVEEGLRVIRTSTVLQPIKIRA